MSYRVVENYKIFRQSKDWVANLEGTLAILFLFIGLPLVLAITAELLLVFFDWFGYALEFVIIGGADFLNWFFTIVFSLVQ